MTLSDALAIATEFQRWRRGQPPYDWGQDGAASLPYTPAQVGEALDLVIEAARSAITNTSPHDDLP